jgi:hypothetical protein
MWLHISTDIKAQIRTAAHIAIVNSIRSLSEKAQFRFGRISTWSPPSATDRLQPFRIGSNRLEADVRDASLVAPQSFL